MLKTMRRGVVGVLLASAALLAGCTVQTEPVAPSPTEAETTAFADVYDQRIDWRPCALNDAGQRLVKAAGRSQESVLCATASVPLDWSSPERSDRIDVAMMKLAATSGAATGSLLMNPGGPGEEGWALPLTIAASSPEFADVAAAYDLIGFDPRGIGQSSPLTCTDGDDLADSIAACVEGNEIARFMGTTSVARDMDVIRAISGDEKLNYLGYSYGTVLGATYATLYPDRVGRMVLDSADDATFGTLINDFQQRIAIAQALAVLAESCPALLDQRRAPCAFTSEQSLLALLAQLDSKPWRASDGVVVTGAVLYDYLVSVLYHGKLDRADALGTLAAAAQGDRTSVDAVRQEAVGAAPGGKSAQQSGPASVSLAGVIVTCHSRPAEDDVAAFRSYVEQSEIPALLGGDTARETLINGEIEVARACAGLPEMGDSAIDEFEAPNANPILVISLTGDHATPYPGAVRLVEGLGNASLLTVDGVGHAVSFFERSACTDAAVTFYLTDGELPADGAHCDADF